MTEKQWDSDTVHVSFEVGMVERRDAAPTWITGTETPTLPPTRYFWFRGHRLFRVPRWYDWMRRRTR